jgi:hypothetical protein
MRAEYAPSETACLLRRTVLDAHRALQAPWMHLTALLLLCVVLHAGIADADESMQPGARQPLLGGASRLTCHLPSYEVCASAGSCLCL